MLEQFDPTKEYKLDPEMEGKKKYAMYRSTYIQGCLKKGETPVPPKPAEGEAGLEAELA